jgi:hypothetical protein
VCYRLIDPGSEWRLHRQWFEQSAMADLLGEDHALVAKNALYRGLDKLLPHKAALFSHLRARYMIWRALAGNMPLPLAFTYADSIISAAASLTDWLLPIVIRTVRDDLDEGLRSSAFRVLVHFEVPLRMMSTMFSDILFLIFVMVVPLRFSFNYNRRLAPIRVCDPRTGKMESHYDGLRYIGANLGQDGVHTGAAPAKFAKWILDAGGPVDAGDFFSARSAPCDQTVAVDPEREL